MASKELESNKLEPIISLDEVQRLVDLGIGRGIDATKPNLWRDKSSFQVQSVLQSLDNIIGTDEGGTRQYYEREVSSINSQQTQLKLSVDEPNMSVSIGMDTQFSKSVSKSKKSVGEQVVTRTISFRSDFDDLPLQFIDDKVLKQKIKYVAVTPQSSASTEVSELNTEVIKSFEEKLSDWLLDRIRGRGENVGDSNAEDTTPVHEDTTIKVDSSVTKIANYLHTCQENSNQFLEVVNDCFVFVKQMGVTHYVHSIRLGGMRFLVLSSTEYNKKITAQGSLGVEGVAKSSIGRASLSHNLSSSLKVKEIGNIVDGSVRKGTSDEAVIGFQLMPIHKLVRSHHVNIALKKALRNYIMEKADKSGKA